jgi:hypothetical protein
MAQTRPFWLIRKSDFRFLRPVAEHDLIQMIESGQLKSQDEICQANGYWFSLQDVAEVRAHLGDVKLNSLMVKGAEITSSTDTDPLPKTKLIQPAHASASQSSSVSGQSTMANFRSLPVAQEQPNEPHDRKRALIFVVTAFLVFLFLLISIWSGTH